MSGVVDYAGLFPPAGLAMPRAVENYAAFRGGPHRWMLGRFICPAARMGEFAECAAADLAKGGDTWPIAALVGTAEDGTAEDGVALLAQLETDLGAMCLLAKRFGAAVRIDALECRLPVPLVQSDDAAAIEQLVSDISRQIATGAPGPVNPYFEIPFAGDWRRHVPRVISALVAHNRGVAVLSGNCGPCAVKIRTGGVEAGMFPSVDQVTSVLRACATEHIAFKATAGLHHPVRHFAESVGTKMHGFVNLFGAAALTQAHDLDAGTIACILEDETDEHFRLDAHALHWQHLSVSAKDIAESRAQLAHGFGSCSFDEPVEDLRGLNWL